MWRKLTSFSKQEEMFHGLITSNRYNIEGSVNETNDIFYFKYIDLVIINFKVYCKIFCFLYTVNVCCKNIYNQK